MKNSPLLIVELMTIFLGLLSTGLLLFANKTNRIANRFLAVHIVCLTIFMVTAALSQTDFYFLFPHVYRAVYPVYLLIYPSAYLYIREILADKTKISKYDLSHFIPALLTALQFIPFYKLSRAEKLQYLYSLFHTPAKLTLINEGYLPAGILSTLVYVIGLIYLIAGYKIYVKFKRSTALRNNQFNVISEWALFCIVANCVVPACYVGMLIIHPPMSMRFSIIVCFQGLLISTFLVYLFLKPEILYGIDHLKFRLAQGKEQFNFVEQHTEIHLQVLSIKEEKHKKFPDPGTDDRGKTKMNEYNFISTTAKDDIADDLQNNEACADETNESVELEAAPGKYSKSATSFNFEKYANLIEDCFHKEQLFLKHGFSIRALSEHIQIPEHHITNIFNRHLGQRFNDYVNTCRIRYIADNKGTDRWKNLTIEGIGWEAGFKSRITFFKAIKRHTGLSPSKFLEDNERI